MANIQAPTKNYVSQGRHGKYNAIDYAARTSRWIPYFNSKNIYATEDGKITNYGYAGTMGNRLELTSTDGRRRWGYGHLQKALVKKGAKVKRGQLVGIMGYTGFTIPKGVLGTHLHLVCLTAGRYAYPPTLYNKPFSVYKPGTTPVYYRVRLGDTVGKICKKYGLTLDKFKKLNPKVKNVNIIYPGQKLRVK
jgi:murein DD-endopeptidase MepM/ murein hydrolase activator NlpD